MPVTVQEAIRKGYRTVNLPSGGLFLAGVVIGFILNNEFKYPGWIFALTGGLGLLLSVIYWSIATTKWKIWAYENVDHIHEFEKKAREARMIDTPSDFMLYQSQADKQRLQQLQQRFKKADVFDDDILVPADTEIHFSKKAGGALIVFGLLVAALGVWLYYKNTNIFGCLVAAGFAAYLIFMGLKEYLTKAPQIIINAKGIQTAKTPFHPWSEIKNDEVRTIVSGRNRTSNTYLMYNYPGGSEQLNIEDLAIDDEQLQHLLHVYRTRSEKAVH